MGKPKKRKDYDSDPVLYCPRCYSLKIIHEDAVDSDCCGDCGCSDIKTTSMDRWSQLYEERYGHRFLEAKKDIKKSPVFLLSIDELKAKVFNSPNWKEICKRLYPSFPKNLNKADSVILLFSKLCQDNRIDALRIFLIKHNNK